MHMVSEFSVNIFHIVVQESRVAGSPCINFVKIKHLKIKRERGHVLVQLY